MPTIHTIEDQHSHQTGIHKRTYANVPTSFLFDRGFTGHEHLDAFGLINMNGRVYDPEIAHFLSPDPFVQNAGSSQNYDRYAYGLNNPLKYVDPSGYDYGTYITEMGMYWDNTNEVSGVFGNFSTAAAFASGRFGGALSSNANNFMTDYSKPINFDGYNNQEVTLLTSPSAYQRGLVYSDVFNPDPSKAFRRATNGNGGHWEVTPGYTFYTSDDGVGITAPKYVWVPDAENGGGDSRISWQSDFDFKFLGGFGAAAQFKGGAGAEAMVDMTVIYEASNDGQKWTHYRRWKDPGTSSYTSVGISPGAWGINYNLQVQHNAYHDYTQSLSGTVGGIFGITFQDTNGNFSLFIGLQPSASLGLGYVITSSVHYGINIKL